MQALFYKDRSGEPGVFWFSFIFFHKQHLRPLGYCASLQCFFVSDDHILIGGGVIKDGFATDTEVLQLSTKESKILTSAQLQLDGVAAGYLEGEPLACGILPS